MACRGMLYAITSEQEAEVLRRDGKQQELVEYLENLWNEEWQTETDKSWDGMHRALNDGDLHFEFSSPLAGVVLGGKPLHSEDWFIIVYKTPAQVAAVATALDQFSDDEMRQRYFAIDQSKYDGEIGTEDWEYTIGWFKHVREFYRKAAAAHRAVIFAVDQ